MPQTIILRMAGSNVLNKKEPNRIQKRRITALGYMLVLG